MTRTNMNSCWGAPVYALLCRWREINNTASTGDYLRVFATLVVIAGVTINVASLY